jgi:hypothetical protein
MINIWLDNLDTVKIKACMDEIEYDMLPRATQQPSRLSRPD